MPDKIDLVKYSSEFFTLQSSNDKKKNAAALISKLVLDLCGNVKSVIDVGCGVGVWPLAFLEHGVPLVQGVDGSYVEKDLRLLGERNFIERDLSQRINIDNTYDLACSLEVAEHLPPERAGTFVEDLTKLAPVVLFSAAIPGQGGDNHVNEMWQHHWARLFAKNGFRAVDYVRPMIWSMVELQTCYRQNILLYVHDDVLKSHPGFKSAREKTNDNMLALVHPRTLFRLEKKWGKK